METAQSTPDSPETANAALLDAPPPPPSPTPKRVAPRYTPAQIRISRHLPAAITAGWSARQLANAADVDYHTAKLALRKAHAQISAQSQAAIGADSSRLAQEARKARERALDRLESLGQAVDNVASKLKDDPQADARDVASAVKAAAELHRHVEQLTGQDVAKALAIKAGAGGDGAPIAWDGVAAITGQVSALDVEALPVTGEQAACSD